MKTDPLPPSHCKEQNAQYRKAIADKLAGAARTCGYLPRNHAERPEMDSGYFCDKENATPSSQMRDAILQSESNGKTSLNYILANKIACR
jgi:hypothetical protein